MNFAIEAYILVASSWSILSRLQKPSSWAAAGLMPTVVHDLNVVVVQINHKATHPARPAFQEARLSASA